MARPIEIADLARIKYVDDPHIRPDGRDVAFVITEVDLDADGYRSAIWLADVNGQRRRRLTAGRTKDTAPRWSPDGSRLAFLSDRDGATQLWVIDVDGGEATCATDLEHGVADPVWLPDGGGLLVTSKVGAHGMLLRAEISEEERKQEAERGDVKVITSLKYKLDGEGFLGEERRRLFLVPLDGGRPRQLTDGDWNDGQPAVSPDGRLIAFVSNRTDDRERNTISDIWVLELAGGEPRPITASDGAYGLPAFSPDGRSIAYIGHPFSERYGPNTIDDLWVADVSGREIRNLTAELDRDIGNSCLSDTHYQAAAARPVWSADGRAVHALVSDRGSVRLARFDLRGEHATVVGGEREVINFSLGRDGTVAFLASSPVHPPEVFVAAPDGSDEVPVSRANDQLLAEIEVAEPERFSFQTRDGATIDAWLLKPPGFRDGPRYPLILQIHGGPHAMYGNTFFHEMQVLAARGYVVLYSNPRGSTGAGQEFMAGAMGDWGGTDYRDLMETVDTVRARGFIDEGRLGVEGGSYGGYMTNWIVTQTDRFRAAVTERSTSNRHNLFGTSDLVWSYGPSEFRGAPWESADFYFERSPISHVANVTTPLLILHSENDLRCPIEQAEQLFVALKALRKTVEFVRFPDESHGMSRSGKPRHRVERLERIVGWFDRFL